MDLPSELVNIHLETKIYYLIRFNTLSGIDNFCPGGNCAQPLLIILSVHGEWIVGGDESNYQRIKKSYYSKYLIKLFRPVCLVIFFLQTNVVELMVVYIHE